MIEITIKAGTETQTIVCDAFFLEVCEYVARSGDGQMVAKMDVLSGGNETAICAMIAGLSPESIAANFGMTESLKRVLAGGITAQVRT